MGLPKADWQTRSPRAVPAMPLPQRPAPGSPRVSGIRAPSPTSHPAIDPSHSRSNPHQRRRSHHLPRVVQSEVIGDSTTT